MADTQTGQRLGLAGTELGPRSGLRVRPQRPARALFGLLLVAVCVVAVLVIYTRIGDRQRRAGGESHGVGRRAVDRCRSAGGVDLGGRLVPVGAGDGPGVDRRSVRQGAHGRGVAAGGRQRSGPSAGRSVEGVDVGPGAVVGGADRSAGRFAAGAGRDPETAGGDATPVLVEATVAAVPRNLGELVRRRRLERVVVDGGVDGRGRPERSGDDRPSRGGGRRSAGPGRAVPDAPLQRRASDVTPSSTPVSTPAGGG